MATVASPPPTGSESRSAVRLAVPPGQTAVVAVDDTAALEPHLAAWDQLAAAAVEPNVFHEAWMLLPALRSFAGGRMLFLLVYAADPGWPQGPPLLAGFFPLERARHYKGVPVSLVRTWRHLHCVLATPLMRAEYGPQCLTALWHWLATDRRGAALLELGFLSADGPFHQLLVDQLNAHKRPTYVEEVTTRALLRTAGDADVYLEAAISGGGRKELRRQRRRLAEAGKLESLVLQDGKDLDRWIELFLQLEASGWKGQHRTALATHDNESHFFRAAAREAFARRRLMMLGLFLDGKPIALKCNFLMGEGAVAFKIAFHEEYARYSPGVQLELDNIALAHRQPGLRWMDSCAVSLMQTVLVATGRRGGDLAVSVLPLLRWGQRLVRRPRPTGDRL